MRKRTNGTDHDLPPEPSSDVPPLRLEIVGMRDLPGEDGLLYRAVFFAVVDDAGQRLTLGPDHAPVLVQSLPVPIGRAVALPGAN